MNAKYLQDSITNKPDNNRHPESIKQTDKATIALVTVTTTTYTPTSSQGYKSTSPIIFSQGTVSNRNCSFFRINNIRTYKVTLKSSLEGLCASSRKTNHHSVFHNISYKTRGALVTLNRENRKTLLSVEFY